MADIRKGARHFCFRCMITHMIKHQMWFAVLLSVASVALLVAQNTTQVSLSDAQRAAYWRAQYELQQSECNAEKVRANWVAVIGATCPTGQSISTATPNGEPTCVSQ